MQGRGHICRVVQIAEVLLIASYLYMHGKGVSGAWCDAFLCDTARACVSM